MAKTNISITEINERINKLYEAEIKKYFSDSDKEIKNIDKIKENISILDEFKKEVNYTILASEQNAYLG